MSLPRFVFAFLVLINLVASAHIASAQATRTWVSGVGDDVNPCSRTAPCKTFAGAISKTAANGIIDCIDQGAYGAVTITKSITIDCSGVTAGVLHSTTNGVIVNAAATDVVTLRGLQIDGSPATAPGLNGVRFLAGGMLNIENCSIRDSNGAPPNGNGVLFAPSTGTPELHISGSRITGHGSAANGAGVQIAPTGTAGARVIIENALISNNTIGVRVDANGTVGTVNVSIKNSVVSESSFHGVTAVGVAGTVRMVLDGVLSANNLGEGVRAVGANATIVMANSTVTGNGTGISVVSSGKVESFGTNHIRTNTNDGLVPTLVPLR